MRRLLLICISVALIGCALLPQRPPPILPLLAPQALGASRASQQVLHVAYGKQVLTLQAALQAAPARDTLIAVGPFGQRVFTLDYDGSQIHAEVGTDLPDTLQPRQVLADVELALWPLDAWQHRLSGSGWTLNAPQPGVRRLCYHDRLVTEVHYDDGSDGWNGRFWLVNLVYGYTLDITSTSTRPTSASASDAGRD